MNTPRSSEKAPSLPPKEPSHPPSGESAPRDLDSIQGMATQQEEFKLEIESLNQEMEVLRGWFQTLVSGLLIAIVIAISIASWFAYRLLIQQESIDQEATAAKTEREELLQRVTTLEEQLSKLTEDVGTSSANFRGTFQTNQADIELLRDRLNKLESRQSSLEADNQTAPEDNKTNSDR